MKIVHTPHHNFANQAPNFTPNVLYNFIQRTFHRLKEILTFTLL
jgi:hypothetical protein